MPNAKQVLIVARFQPIETQQKESGSYAEQIYGVYDGLFMHKIPAPLCEGWNPYYQEKQNSFN